MIFSRKPRPTDMFVSLTAACNLRCKGCRYGRDFMPGNQLAMEDIEHLFLDASMCGIKSVRLYGGEPLIHPDIDRIVASCVQNGMRPWLTTNGMLLDRKIDAIYRSGLRRLSIGFYGTRKNYDDYVQKNGAFEKLERNVALVRERYGNKVRLKLEVLLMRPTCNPNALESAVDFALRFETPITINLVHYSLPYFTDLCEEDREGQSLQFTEDDREMLEEYTARLLAYQRRYPKLINRAYEGLASIPDWLIKRSEMRVPCDKSNMIWVGPDGTVQLCYVTFKLGNLREKRLIEMIGTESHRQAMKDCRALNCPNCHCGFSSRIHRHRRSRTHYRAEFQRLISK